MSTETKAKHTPGPWNKPRRRSDGKRIIIKAAGDEEFRVEVDSDDCDEKIAMANATLITAAPDLLRELNHLVRLMEPVEDHLNIPGLATLNAARAAIAKAGG